MDASEGVLAASFDADEDPLTLTLVSGPSDGTLTLNADGSFSYVPNAGFVGEDGFTYQVSDGAETDQEDVLIHVTNTASRALGDSYSTDVDQTLTNIRRLWGVGQ